MKPPRLVRIIWEDACCLDGSARWVDHQDHAYKPLLVESVGYLLHDGPAGVIITAAWSAECIGPRDQIPRGMIRKIVRLKD